MGKRQGRQEAGIVFFFTADEHYGHGNIIRFTGRPFGSVGEMDETLIANHNAVVGPDDVVVHAGDFTMRKNRAQEYIKRLSGLQHIFLRGSHDKWLPKDAPYILELKEENRHITICHYCMRTWPKSHFNSWHLYGHSHGRLPPIGKSWDVGVDNNGFYPLSFWDVVKIMEGRPDNPNLVEGKSDD